MRYIPARGQKKDMRRGYNLVIDAGTRLFAENFCDEGKKLQQDFSARVTTSLTEYLDEDGNIDSTKILDDWFPTVKAEVFISHSHKDENLALGLAGYLKEKMNMTCFVDSAVWKSCDKLFEIMAHNDAPYHLFGSESKIIEKLSPRVYMILVLALQKMLYQTPNIIFINTSSSLLSESVGKAFTDSPWISFELSFANILLAQKDNTGMQNFSEGLAIMYPIELDRFRTIGEDSLIKWSKEDYSLTLEDKLQRLDGIAINRQNMYPAYGLRGGRR